MRNDPQGIARDVDQYIFFQPEKFKPTLEEMRSIIHSVIPQAQESISYMVPCFKHLYMLVGIGVNKKYCSFYTMSPSLVKKLGNELEGIKYSGSTLHFTPGEPLPVELLKKIITLRIQENELRAMRKK
jgi:uncharacterized protein YdhG (YjbR/CyaY superfamily)